MSGVAWLGRVNNFLNAADPRVIPHFELRGLMCRLEQTANMIKVAHGIEGPRLGALTEARGLWFSCDVCQRSAVMPMATARHLWGVRTRLSRIARDVRCGRCGGVNVDVRPHYAFPRGHAPQDNAR